MKRSSAQISEHKIYYIKNRSNHPNYKNNEFKYGTWGCYATVFLAVTLILGGQYVITEPLSVVRHNDKHIESCTQKDDL